MRYVVWSKAEFDARKTAGTILKFIQEHGHPPTLRELGALRGWRSANTAQRKIKQAVAIGTVTATGKARGYEVAEPVVSVFIDRSNDGC